MFVLMCSACARNLKCRAEGAGVTAEDPLQCTNAFCSGERAPRPSYFGQTHFSHPPNKCCPSNAGISLDKAKRGQNLLMFLKSILKITAEDLYLYQSLIVPQISLAGSLWKICFLHAGCLSLLAALGAHSIFLSHGLAKHICNCSYVTKCSNQARDTWAYTDSQINPHRPRLGNKSFIQRAQSCQRCSASLCSNGCRN